MIKVVEWAAVLGLWAVIFWQMFGFSFHNFRPRRNFGLPPRGKPDDDDPPMGVGA